MRQRRRRITNRVMMMAVTACAALAISLMFLIVGYIAVKGISYLNPTFVTATPAPLGETGGGIKHAIVGTVILVGIAMALAVPAGISAGVFLSEYAGPRARLVLRFLADTLTGVPSIVVGVFIYALIVVHTGFSALSGGVALAVIMLPIVARTAEEALYLVPRDQREAALALGTPKWRVVSSIAVPGAAPAIVTGCLLATARAAGETAPLLFTALGNNFYSTNINDPIAAMPIIIFRYALTPYAVLHDQAWATAFILVALMLVLSAVTRWVVSRGTAQLQ
jgi:phosphate transport system permease protein